jgi:hypothetical protein
MKRNLQKILLFTVFLFAFNPNSNAAWVTVNGSATWLGYMNVFDNAGNYQWGSGWGLSDLKSTINTSANTVTLQPNFNVYNATDAYWVNTSTGIGIKNMEANTFVENNSYAGQTLVFQGNVVSNTLATGYTAIAFIKGLNPNTGYSLDIYQSAPLVAGTPFNLIAASIPSGLIVQYGFMVYGLNANPADESALGSVVVSGLTAPLNITNNSLLAHLEQNAVKLNWETSNDESIENFLIEKSIDGKNFSQIGAVNSKKVATSANYQFLDKANFISNVNYYRLKQMNSNGSFAYSQITSVKFNTFKNFIAPNPANNSITIYNNQNVSSATICNAFGMDVKEVALSAKSITLDISALPIGMYFVKYNNGTSQQFVKQ